MVKVKTITEGEVCVLGVVNKLPVFDCKYSF